MLCKKFLRRRTIIKCLLLLLAGYMTYISLASFDEVAPTIRKDKIGPVPVDPDEPTDELRDILRHIDEQDNFKNYDEIKINGT